MKRLLLLLSLLAAVRASASITEIRQNFFNQTANLPATAIMSAPSGDASYLISVYETTSSCAAVPTLRWTDENDVLRSAQGVVGPGNGNCYLSLLQLIRVKSGTTPTIETTGGDIYPYNYSLYVSGLGFWTSGAQGQGGLSKLVGYLPADLVYEKVVYTAAASTSALLVAESRGYVGRDIPSISWWDELHGHSVSVPVGTAGAVVPLRMASGTNLVLHTYPGDTTKYQLVFFGTPAMGSGPFTDYEYNLLNWANATYPTFNVLFAAGADTNILLLSNITERANSGSVGESLYAYWTNQTGVPCAAGLTAGPSGAPASCVSPVFVGSGSPLEFRIYNSTGSPWGGSPTYSVEVDAIQF